MSRILMAMCLFFIAFLLYTSGCGLTAKRKDTPPPAPATTADVLRRARTMAAMIPDPYKTVDRCDSLTFAGLYAASTAGVWLYKHEYTVKDGAKTYTTGDWHRSTESCAGTSAAECSQEGILSALHLMWSVRDAAGIVRLVDRAEKHGWRFCDGRDDLAVMPQLAPLLQGIRARVQGKKRLAAPSAIPAGFRGNVLASYIALKGRVFGYVRGVELDALKDLAHDAPDNPLYAVLAHRFGDGNDEPAVALLTSADYPEGSLPLVNRFSWEGSNAAMMYVWSAFLLTEPRG